MNDVIFMHGVPGSGKSFLAKRLDGNILSTDHFFNKNGKYQWDAKYLPEANAWNLGRFYFELFKNYGLVLIIDNTNLQAAHIKPYVDACKKFGCTWEIQEPNTEWRYDAKICAEKNTHGVPIETIERMLDKRETVEQIYDSLRK